MEAKNQKSLVAAKTAIREVMANFPPGVWWVYAADAVTTYLGEAQIDCILPDEIDEFPPNAVALLPEQVIEWDGETEEGVVLKPRKA